MLEKLKWVSDSPLFLFLPHFDVICDLSLNIRTATWTLFVKRFTCKITTYSGAPARAKRAWHRAPYSWNMVNLFSFGCHVTDRAYVRTSVRTYASTDCTGRVGETIGREGCLRRVLASPHLLYMTLTIWSIDTCQNRIATDQYPMTISRAHVSTHRGDVIYLEAVR